MRVDRLTGLPYPKVVTLNQISTLLLQSLLEVSARPSSHSQDGTINRNDSSHGRGQSEEDSDTEVETRSEGASVASYLGANASATPSLPVGEGASDATPEVNADATPEVNADATPEVNADATPEVNVDATPEVNADATPEVNVDATPEVNADRTLQDAKEVAEEVKKKELVVKQPMSLSKEGRSRISRFLNTPCGHSGGL